MKEKKKPIGAIKTKGRREKQDSYQGVDVGDQENLRGKKVSAKGWGNVAVYGVTEKKKGFPGVSCLWDTSLNHLVSKLPKPSSQ